MSYIQETKTIFFNKQPIAHIFYRNIKAQGVKFLTPDSYTLQLGLLEHPKGKIIRDHMHRQDIKYKVNTAQEFLYVEKGSVKIRLFGPAWQKLRSVTLNAGDFVLFVSGGHGLEILKKCRMIEVKQGPYPGESLAKIYKN
jgi:hypothetical protein